MKLRTILIAAILPLVMAGKCDPGPGATCPSDVQYSDAFLDAVTKELNVVASQAPHIVQMLGDYDVTLQQIRHCIRKQKKK